MARKHWPLSGERAGTLTRQTGLIVMDLHVPKNDGMEVLQEIRGNAELADLPVPVLSSAVSPEEKSNIAAFRATCFMTKPSDRAAFINVGQITKQMALAAKASTAEAAS